MGAKGEFYILSSNIKPNNDISSLPPRGKGEITKKVHIKKSNFSHLLEALISSI